MLDGVQDESKYPSDFFIDLVFQDEEVELNVKEDKNKLWEQIVQNCGTKRTTTDKGTKALEELKTSERTEAEPEFVIEGPTVDDIPEDKVVETEGKTPGGKEVSSLEQEAIRMHKELLEDDEVKAKVEQSKDQKEDEKAKIEVKKEETIPIPVEIKKEEVPKRKGSMEKEKKDKKNEGKKAETERADDDEEIDLYLSNITSLLKSSR